MGEPSSTTAVGTESVDAAAALATGETVVATATTSHRVDAAGVDAAAGSDDPAVDPDEAHAALQALVAVVGAAHVLVADADKAGYLVDWRKRYVGRALAVVRPGSVDEVAGVVRACAAHRLSVVPQGGNTGLVGGATPDTSGRQVVLSTTRLRAVRVVDPVNDTITVGAGCTLAAVQAAAADVGRLFPLSLASEGSCTIGGNLSTNAGGTAVLRYGNARDLCLGVEAVLPDGSVVRHLDGLRKDNTGYHWSDLLVGAEGTLGVVTAATLKLYPMPRGRAVAWAALASPHDALVLLALARERCGATLTAFELVSDFALSLVEKHFAGARAPFAGRTPQNVLLEISDHEDDVHAQQLLQQLLSDAIDAGVVHDAAIAEDLSRQKALWSLRENISEAQAAEGRNIKHDISVPLSRIADFVAATDAALATGFPGIRMVTFGHLGDGNLHYNVSPPVDMDPSAFLALQPAINRVVHDAVVAAGGSISAEHGIGQLKRDELQRYKSPSEMTMMRAIKKALDPLGLMNPGKVL